MGEVGTGRVPPVNLTAVFVGLGAVGAVGGDRGGTGGRVDDKERGVCLDKEEPIDRQGEEEAIGGVFSKGDEEVGR